MGKEIKYEIENHFHIREDMDSCHEYKLSDPATGKYMEFLQENKDRHVMVDDGRLSEKPG